MVHEKLKDLKTKKKLTNHKISELSGIPLSTVTKIINGKTDNPSFQSIKDITMAMGGSLDEVAEIQPPIFDQRKDPVEYSAQIELYALLLICKKPPYLFGIGRFFFYYVAFALEKFLFIVPVFSFTPKFTPNRIFYPTRWQNLAGLFYAFWAVKLS